MAEIHYQMKDTDHPESHVSWWNNQKREQLSREMLEEALRFDLPAIISMIGYIGQWDEQIQSLQEQGYLIGDNTSYPQDLT